MSGSYAVLPGRFEDSIARKFSGQHCQEALRTVLSGSSQDSIARKHSGHETQEALRIISSKSSEDIKLKNLQGQYCQVVLRTSNSKTFETILSGGSEYSTLIKLELLDMQEIINKHNFCKVCEGNGVMASASAQSTRLTAKGLHM